MKVNKKNEEYEQLQIELGDELASADLSGEPTPEELQPITQELVVGAAVAVNPEAKRFCDGRGIPDYARKAYVKRINPDTKTVVLETKPNGKELGLLFISDITLI